VSATPATTDVVYSILGASDNGKIAQLRNVKPNQIDELQNYYLALFEPDAESSAAFGLNDRYLIAVRAASHTRSVAVANWYADLAARDGVSNDMIERARDVAAPWSDETKLGAAVRHADLLVTRTSDARREDIETLKSAGFSPAGILSLSQVIAFVSYQLRLIAGLRAFGAES
jgi:uncharacterized protein YciW